MKNKIKFFFGVLLGTIFLFLGCVAPEKRENQQGGQAPEVTSPVQILWDRPAVPFMILGRVQASAPVETSDDALYVALQKQGEKLFANAVVIQQGGIQAVRDGNEVKKNVAGWAISYTSHEPVHQPIGVPKTQEQEEEEDRNVPTGFGLLP